MGGFLITGLCPVPSPLENVSLASFIFRLFYHIILLVFQLTQIPGGVSGYWRAYAASSCRDPILKVISKDVE